MFDQTFVPAGRTTKPGSLLLSAVIQLAVVTALVVASLVYSQALPFGQLHAFLIAPRPPQTPRVTVHAIPHAPARPSLNPLHLQPLQLRMPPVQRLPANAVPTILTENPESASDVLAQFGEITSAYSPGTAQPPTARTSPRPTAASGPLRIGGSVAAANLIERVVPSYPRIAAAAGIAGTVEFSAIIGRDGRIANLKLLRGHPLLVRAATEAVLQWRYRPTLLNGIPVEVATDITVQFNLSNGR